MAHVTTREGHEFNLAFVAERGFRKIKIDADGNVPALLGATSGASESSKATSESAAKELLEDVLETTELAEEILPTEGLSPVETRTFPLVRKHLVRLGNLSETRFRGSVTWIGIWMRLSEIGRAHV
jgi:hypothetical protein